MLAHVLAPVTEVCVLLLAAREYDRASSLTVLTENAEATFGVAASDTDVDVMMLTYRLLDLETNGGIDTELVFEVLQ